MNSKDRLQESLCRALVEKDKKIKELEARIKNNPEGNTGDYNTGKYNYQNYNSGYYNSGNQNTGDYNSGDYNTGHRNSGYHNTGNYNTGDYNSGYCNSGYHNSGNHNTGDYNSGDYNTGDYNTDNHNTGDYNTGHCNSGNHNLDNWCSGNWNLKSTISIFGIQSMRFVFNKIVTIEDFNYIMKLISNILRSVEEDTKPFYIHLMRTSLENQNNFYNDTIWEKIGIMNIRELIKLV